MSLLRPTLAQIRAYVPTPPREGHRLHLNEAPTDLPAEFKEAAMRRALAADWSRYPEDTDALIRELAEADGWHPEGVLVGNGSNEFLQTVTFGTLSPGDAIVLAAPSFSLYATQAKAAGARVVEVPMRSRPGEPFRFEIERLISAVNENAARLVIVATPNNPTGTLLAPEDLRALHDRTDAFIAVDEAYRHFAAQDLVPVLRDCPRMALLRTYSKSFAAAALRLGYLLASSEICVELHKLMMPYNLGSLSTAVARELLRWPGLLDQRIRFVTAERERVSTALAAHPRLRVEKGGANFVVVEHASTAARELASKLADRSILVRDLSGYAGCERCLRISVGTREANDALVAALTEVA